jgi:hypothetical protein
MAALCVKKGAQGRIKEVGSKVKGFVRKSGYYKFYNKIRHCIKKIKDLIKSAFTVADSSPGKSFCICLLYAHYAHSALFLCSVLDLALPIEERLFINK